MNNREFTLKYVFENAGKLEEYFELDSPEEEHFGVNWKINIQRFPEVQQFPVDSRLSEDEPFPERLGIWLYANMTKNQEIYANLTLKIFSKNKQYNDLISASQMAVFRKSVDHWVLGEIRDDFIDWETINDKYLDDGKLRMEIHVKIRKMVRKELRSFGKEMKQFSDVILKVKDRKFYVSKLYLSSHSPYFATLFLGKFQESEKSEIELKDMSPEDFQYYLEVLYGENGIDDQTVLGILSVADMLNTRLSVKKCKEFLVKESEMGLKEMTDKEFPLKYVFKDVGKLEYLQNLFSPEEKHFGVNWKIKLQKRNENLGVWLYADITKNQKISTAIKVKIISKNKEKTHSRSRSKIYEKRESGWDVWGCSKFIDWKTLKDEYLDDGKLEVEFLVKITKMVQEELRSFGEEMKRFSDVVLKIENQMFYVSKLYLSSQSPYFATLFLRKFQESEKSEFELKDMSPEDFQYYLEILYGECGVDDQTVLGILSVAGMLDTPLSVKKCEEYLVKESKLALKQKLQLAGNYGLEELKKMCLDQTKSKEDIRSVIPENPGKMDPEILAELLKKSLAFD
ncbi:hypothetical protein B9Z55_007864 [Caenorhabditis nigoni]|uniref:BTB domain-containing protein n=1 Tax=Caenorhabditis nigoni TaxID=1611254 RepID=A0A2G5VC92_9PELO|nr:hypothetical protein B9Z55_007864 [Caenorhabditis nigoni]